MPEVRHARAEEMSAIRALMRDYAAWAGVDLSFQDFDRECRELPGEYAPPHGALLVGIVGEALAGMVALRARSSDTCEMKRLFVRASARGSGLGRALVEHVIDEARRRGYREMVLDTLPAMRDAQQMYARFGFRDIEPYYVSPVVGTRFMALRL